MKEVSKGKDRFINLDELKAAICFEEDGDLDKSMVTFNGGMPLPAMPSDMAEKKQVHIPDPVLVSIKLKVKKAMKVNLFPTYWQIGMLW